MFTKPLENRKTPLMSKRKLRSAIKFFEKYVDEEINGIEIISSSYYRFKTPFDEYSIDIKNNKINKTYPDPE